MTEGPFARRPGASDPAIWAPWNCKSDGVEGVGAVVMMAGLVVLGVSLRWWWSISRGTPSGDRTITAAGLGLMLIVVGIWIQVATG